VNLTVGQLIVWLIVAGTAGSLRRCAQAGLLAAIAEKMEP
jgi:hypothetical protein